MSDEDLIESVHQFSIIWDKKDPNHKNKLHVRNAWQSIGSALQLSADICEQRFANIRNRYCKERRNMQDATRSGAGAYEIQWPHYEACSFLEKVIVSRRRSNYSQSEANNTRLETETSARDESEAEDSQLATVENVLMVNETDDEVLTLHDVFQNRQSQYQKRSVPTISSCSSNNEPDNRHYGEFMPQTPSTSHTPSSRSEISITPSGVISRSSSDSSGSNRKDSRKGKKMAKTDEVENLSKCIAGAFDKFDQLVAQSSQSGETPLELTDEDYAFGRTVALSLKQIRSAKMRMKLKSKIMFELAEAVDDD